MGYDIYFDQPVAFKVPSHIDVSILAEGGSYDIDYNQYFSGISVEIRGEIRKCVENQPFTFNSHDYGHNFSDHRLIGGITLQRFDHFFEVQILKRDNQ